VSRECRIEIDAEACTGHGRCYGLAPNAFTEDGRGHGQVGIEDVPAELMAEVRSAIANCPERAVRLVFSSGKTDVKSD
jgi:ferredoxin